MQSDLAQFLPERARDLAITDKDKERIRNFIWNGGWTDGLFDRNWAARMEREGWLKETNAAMHGERRYEPTNLLYDELKKLEPASPTT